MDHEFFPALLHRLRGPLNVIAGWTGVLRTGQATPDMLRQAAEAIERSCQAQAELVAAAVELWGLTEGTGKLERVPVDLGACVHAAAETARARAHGRLIAVDQPSAVEVLGDRVCLERAVALLVRHAVDRSAAGATVRVRVAAEGAAATVQVTDTGPALNGRDLAYLFDRLRPPSDADGHSPEVPHGQVNLEMAIARYIVALHLGTLTGRSAPGGGLTVTLTMALG